MPYALQYTSSSGKWASYPQLDIASGENFTIEFTARVDVTGISRIVGGATSNTVSRIWMQQGGAPNFRITNAAGTSADWTFTISLGVYYKVRFVRVGSTIELFIDDASQGTRTLSGAFSFDRFFAHATTAGGGCTVQYVQAISSAGTRLYRNDSGTGSIWPDLNNSANNASQVGGWPTDDSEWVFYSSGASNTITVSATLPKITGSITLNEINPSYVISVSGQLPKLTGTAALNEINPVFTVAVAGQLPKLTGSIALNQFANNRQAAVNGVLPKLTGAVALNRIQPNNQAAVSGQLPRITASITLRVPDSYPTANPNDYTVTAYLSTDSTYTARLSEINTINAIISASSTFNARLN